MKWYEYIFATAALSACACGCVRKSGEITSIHESEPLFLSIAALPSGGYSLVSVSPFDGSGDTLEISKPLGRLIVMSTSHIGFLDAIGADSVIVGVSGGEYVCDSSVTAALNAGTVVDVGYDASPDYEKIMALKPDLLLAYSVSPVKSQFLSKLESLGIKTFIVNEHLERHPLARAAYVRLFGALTGNMPAADSVLKVVSERYSGLRDSVSATVSAPRKILVNIPYKDQWFIPGQDSYLTTLFRDAGGEILGAKAGSSASGQVSVETAYSLSKEADLWMNVGWCRTREQLLSVNPLFKDFLMNIQENAAVGSHSGTEPNVNGDTSASVVWNDNKRLNAQGGNDFWESGAVRPDLILRDLVGIFRGGGCEDGLTYYRAIE